MLVLVVIALGAAVLRLPALTAGLPYTSYIDEFAVVDGSTHQIAGGTWDPGRYDYPTFLMSATTVVGGALTWAMGEDLGEGAQVTQDASLTYVLEPAPLILGGRIVVAALSVAMVVAIGLLGRELARWRVGLVAAAVAAVLPALVSRGSILITDTPAAAFTAFALLGAAKVARPGASWRWGAWAGAAAGLAFASKYTGAAAVIVPLVVVAWRTDVGWAARVRGALAIGGAALAAAIIAMPAVLLDPGAIRDGIEFVRNVYRAFSPSDPLLSQAVRPEELGLVLVVAAVPGLVLMVLRPASRKVTVGAGLAAVPVLATLLSSGYQPFRNALVLVPLLCVAVAFTVDAAVGVVGRAASLPRPVTTGAVLAVGAALCLLVVATGTRELVADQRHLVDSRVDARRWLQQTVQPGDRVLVAEQLGFLPRELGLVDAEVVVAPQEGWTVEGEWDLVLAGDLAEAPYAWGELLLDRPQVARFGHLRTSCPRGMRNTPEGRLCPQTPVPDAWHWNDIEVRAFGPVS